MERPEAGTETDNLVPSAGAYDSSGLGDRLRKMTAASRMKRAKSGISRLILNEVLASGLLPERLRLMGLRFMGVRIGSASSMRPDCFLGGTDIQIGSDVFINFGCFLDNAAQIVIGDGCTLAMQVMLCTGTHQIGDRTKRAGVAAPEPVVIKEGCWLGTRVTVLPGVTIAPGCFIAAGALVTKDCEPNGLYAGVPAKRVRDLG